MHMDGPIDWWWKMNLLDVYVQVGFCQIQSQLQYSCNQCMHVYIVLTQVCNQICSIEDLYVHNEKSYHRSGTYIW